VYFEKHIRNLVDGKTSNRHGKYGIQQGSFPWLVGNDSLSTVVLRMVEFKRTSSGKRRCRVCLKEWA